MAWSTDGTKLMSVSDDRSARIWTATGNNVENGCFRGTFENHVSPNLSLYGHGARIWDCCMSDSIVITAGEDCTSRAWSIDGQQFMVLKEHVGRGIWRCLYDPNCSLLVTAGFDSALKVYQVPSSMPELEEQSGTINCLEDHTETFTLIAPRATEQQNLMDSKSEYVRCVHIVRESIIYVATNKGYLYHVNFSSPSDVKWTELIQVHGEAQIICMDVISFGSLDLSSDVHDLIALGDGKGNATVVKVMNDNPSPKLSIAFSWPAEKERQLLVVYWCKSIGSSYLFTSDPKGVVKLWKTMADLPSDSAETMNGTSILLLAIFTSPFGQRIMCLDASIEEEIIFCGDKRGNVILFPLPTDLIGGNSSDNPQLISSLDHFKGAHGISSVTSICIFRYYVDHVEIHTTGGDGCICYFKYSRSVGKVEFIGMKQVKDLSTIQFVSCPSKCEDVMSGKYAIGFTSVDFIVWDLVNETKTIQVPCGGWRRPYSYHLGAVAKYQYCFAYVKDHIIHIQRLWMLSEEKLFPQILHMQFHGREIHSLCFLDFGLQPELTRGSYVWMATGSEDGTVRLTRYSSFEMERWTESKLLGEHVGGSAVRSLCFVSKIFEFKYQSYRSFDKSAHGSSVCAIDDCLLISVGSKQVLTSWILQRGALECGKAGLNQLNRSSQTVSSDSKDPLSSLSFQWLSTHMQPKSASANDNENDLRYLAVTAFLLRHVYSRLTVCFVVASCSDCTLVLRALLLPHRLWFDVAILVPTNSLVLSLQHIVVGGNSLSEEDAEIGNSYIVIGGSTDGSISFWDLTKAVEGFMKQVLDNQPQKLIDCQRRPKTGRGSQGGRRWKSLAKLSSEKKSTSGHTDENYDVNLSESFPECSTSQKSKPLQNLKTSSPPMEQDPCRIHSSEMLEVQPLFALTCVHQSGVNCIHIAELAQHPISSEVNYCLISGGDDQALHILGFSLTIQSLKVGSCLDDSTDSAKFCDQITHDKLSGDCSYHKPAYKDKYKVLFQNKIFSAHSSAVKGVWTDGLWAFSTGLDQRIRCWQINKSGELMEHSSMIVSVPEPEALASVLFDSIKNCYQIAVAGRGMQMVVFAADG